jgi:hypothetical protein
VKLLKVNDSRPIGLRRIGVLAAVLLMPLWVATTPIYGQVIDVLSYAPDITVSLSGTVVEGGVLAADDLSGSVTIVPLPNLPAGARIAAAHRFANGDMLLAFDSTLTLPGAGGIAEPRDLVKFTSATQSYAIQVAGTALNLPTNAAIDAVSVTLSGTILISLDISVDPFDDDDVIAVNGTNLSLFLDPAAVGVDPALDLDGIDYDGSGDSLLFLSFDGSGTVDGVAFDDEDVLQYDITTQTWSLAYDGSEAAAHWPSAADLTALGVVLAAPPTPTPTPTLPAPTGTSTATATDTPTQPGATGTVTATATDTPTVPEPTRTATDTPTTPESTRTATDTPTTPAPTRTATATPTQPSLTGTPTATRTRTPTGPGGTNTATATHTATPPGITATATATATVTAGIPCVGDCDGSGEVTINELITMVNIALGNFPVSACLAGDPSQSGTIEINELVTAVGNAINGCPG